MKTLREMIRMPLLLLLGAASTQVYASEMTIQMSSTVDGKSIGYVEVKDTSKGLELIPHLFDLAPGLHGIHVHQYPNCGHKATDAGSHWDPKATDSHKGPYHEGHLGDLPVLKVNNEGKAADPVIAPHLTVKELYGHSLIIHEGGDDYSDNPPMGGGGARIACGVIS